MNFFQSGNVLRVSRKGQEITKVTVIGVIGENDLLVEDNFNPDRVAHLQHLEDVGCWVVSPSEDRTGVFKPNLHYLLGVAG